MSNKKFFKSKGFSPAWLEDTVPISEKTQIKTEKQDHIHKDLAILLKELDEIKEEFNKISEKKEKLQHLLKIHTELLFN